MRGSGLTIVIGLILYTSSPAQGLLDLDERLFQRLESDNRHPVLDYTIESISLITPFLEGGIALERGLIGWFKGDERARDAGFISGVAVASTELLCFTLKYTVKRERPPRGYKPRIWKKKRITPSFPSGHTASSFAFAAVMGEKYPKYKIALLIYASLSGYSQIYVGNHYPLDVLAGGLIGYGIGRLCLYLEKEIPQSLPFLANFTLTPRGKLTYNFRF